MSYSFSSYSVSIEIITDAEVRGDSSPAESFDVGLCIPIIHIYYNKVFSNSGEWQHLPTLLSPHFTEIMALTVLASGSRGKDLEDRSISSSQPLQGINISLEILLAAVEIKPPLLGWPHSLCLADIPPSWHHWHFKLQSTVSDWLVWRQEVCVLLCLLLAFWFFATCIKGALCVCEDCGL